METTPEPEGGPPRPKPRDGIEGAGGPGVPVGHGDPGVGHEAGPGSEDRPGPGDPPEDWDDVDEQVPHDPLRFNRWMKRSASGAVLSGIALGLQQALEHKRETPAFVLEAPGEPEDPDAPITLHFDPDDPTKTVAVIRNPRPDREHPPGP